MNSIRGAEIPNGPLYQLGGLRSHGRDVDDASATMSINALSDDLRHN